MRQVILHIPHSSAMIPNMDGFIVSNDTIEKEILKLTDWHTDDLFNSTSDIIVKAEFSRIFCDVERFADDSQEDMARFGMGVIYEKTDSGQPLRKLSPDLKQSILENYYYKHHNRLNEAVDQQLDQKGTVIILDCHSFADTPFDRDLDKQPNRPDFCLGTDEFHTPQQLVDTAAQFLATRGYSVGINRPYSGTIVPLRHYQKNKNVISIMLEVNRKLYLKGSSNQKSETYHKTKTVIQDFIEMIRSSD